jgi:hypothetical protein
MVMNPKNRPDNPQKGSAPVCNGHPRLIAYHSSSTLAALTLIKLFVKKYSNFKKKRKKKKNL